MNYSKPSIKINNLNDNTQDLNRGTFLSQIAAVPFPIITTGIIHM